jgi:hypothetical protein
MEEDSREGVVVAPLVWLVSVKREGSVLQLKLGTSKSCRGTARAVDRCRPKLTSWFDSQVGRHRMVALLLLAFCR